MLRLWLVLVFFLNACGMPDSSDLQQSEAFNFPNLFPKYPHPELTPGRTCKEPDEYRYPEKIKYCQRDVPTFTKHIIIDNYDTVLRYSIQRMERLEFKIDHYIPLCLGGSNNLENLWPQHVSIYQQTDPIEHKLCLLLQAGKISQAEAIETVIFAKNNLRQAAKLDSQLADLLQK